MTVSAKEAQRPTRQPSLVLLVLLLAAVVLGFPFLWQAADLFIPQDSAAPGLTGSDRIQAVSALFSALAFVALFYTILLQHHDLQLQKLDQEQLKADVARQAFDGRFFQLLRLHNENVRTQTAQFGPDGEVHTGRRAFRAAAINLEYALRERLRVNEGSITLAEINELYGMWCESTESDFGHYFRNLYHIVKYIDSHGTDGRETYIAHLRAQLSQSEFVLLLVNGLRRSGKSKFKPLIEEWALLHEMRSNRTLDTLKAFFDPRAFGRIEAVR